MTLIGEWAGTCCHSECPSGLDPTSGSEWGEEGAKARVQSDSMGMWHRARLSDFSLLMQATLGQ